MRFIKVLLMWGAAIILPLWIGQILLDAEYLQLTEVVVSVYPGYFLSLAVALGIGFVVRVTLLRMLEWSLGIHIVVSCLVFPMPATFVLGSGLGILICYSLARLSSNILFRTEETTT
jgi:hypothetical protein